MHEQELKSLLKNAGCMDIVSSEHYIEEPIDHWLKDTFFSQSKIDEIKEMFLNAPTRYKEAHKINCSKGDIFDTMRWVIIKGKKK